MIKNKKINEMKMMKLVLIVVFLFLIGLVYAAPQVVLNEPQNNTAFTTSLINLSANFSDASGIKNATIYVYNQNGSFVNSSNASYTAGNAINFNGTNYIQTAAVSLPSGTPLTYAMWIRPNFSSFQQPLVHWNSASSPRAYWRFESATRMYFDTGLTSPKMYWNGNLFCSSTDCNGNVPAYSNGNWYFIVLTGTYSGSTLTSKPILIGSGTPTHPGRYFNGSIDEVLIFNKTLTAAEISQLYNSGNGLYANTSIAPFNSSLILGYHFDEGNGTTAVDITGRYNGTLTNGPTYVNGTVPNPYNITTSINITSQFNLLDGFYNWFAQIFNWTGGSNITENRTLNVNIIAPTISNITNNTYINSRNLITSVYDGYGIKNATLVVYNSTNEIIESSLGLSLQATGGTITRSGAYTIHTFTTNGTFTAPNSGNVETLVVAGGGGGGGSDGGSFDKSSAVFELVRGAKQEFQLTLENKLPNTKENILIKITGNNSQYVSVDPTLINYLGANSNRTIKVNIDAPSYFSSGKYLLQFEFKGNVIGNSTTSFTEVKYVTLTILEMPRKEADGYVNSSLSIVDKMNSSGLKLDEVKAILESMNSDYKNLNFINLKDGSAKIEEIYTAATEYIKLRDELNKSLIESERNGISVSETKKLFLLSEIIFNRGDYIAAYAKLKEAKTSYLLETKGEMKILYLIKNNPIEALSIFISLGLVGIGSSLFIRLKLLKRRLRMLKEEEVLLLQLMKVVQRDCFESNKMSMEEYNEAMYQYENRLSTVIQLKVETETKIANVMKLKGHKRALGQERDRLTVLVKQTQEDYMNRGKLDTRIYENMLKTYATRLSKIEEELVFIEAQDQIREVSGFWNRHFGKK